MTLEQKIKTLIGEYVIQILDLQQQLEGANAKIEELTKEEKDD